MASKIFIGNLNFDTTEETLREVFSEVGNIVDLHIPTDRDTGRRRGIAFIEFENPNAASEAISKLDGYELEGRRLRVDVANERPRREGGGGGFGGGRGGGFGGGGGGFGGGGGGGFGGGGGGGGGGRPFPPKTGGSRRNIRERKRGGF